MKNPSQSKRLYEELNRICLSSVADFTTLATRWWETEDGPLIHIDNGGKILGVAHLDAVMWDQPSWGCGQITCPQLDDRLGVWTLLSALPQMKSMPAFDILLCDSEEKGLSTAGSYMNTQLPDDKEYNWIFEFDRAGTDVVMYQYEDDDSIELLDKYDFDIGIGAFSDISNLEELEIKAFNFGVGYHNQHTKNCWADLRDTWSNIRKFVKFAADLHATKMPHVFGSFVEKYESYGGSWWRGSYANGRSSVGKTANTCPECYDDLKDEWRYCPFCGHNLSRVEHWDRGWPEGYARTFGNEGV